MKRSLIAASLLVVVCFFAMLAEAQAPGANPFVGTWRLNLAKSKYTPGPPPKSDTSKVEAVDGGIRVVHEGVNHQGQVFRNEFTGRIDGKDYPLKGTIDGKPNTSQDTVAVHRLDDYTLLTVAKLKGQMFITSLWVISRDGKTRTNTVTGKDPQGRTLNNSVVYEKQ